MKILRAIIVAILVGVMSSPAASAITLNISGDAQFIESDAGTAPARFGDRLSIVFSVTFDRAQQAPSPYVDVFYTGQGNQFVINGQALDVSASDALGSVATYLTGDSSSQVLLWSGPVQPTVGLPAPGDAFVRFATQFPDRNLNGRFERDPSLYTSHQSGPGVIIGEYDGSISLYGPLQLTSFAITGDDPAIAPRDPALPEPQTWALMIVGLGFVGGAVRQRRYRPAISI